MNNLVADTVLMIEPSRFAFNYNTFVTNKFQQNIKDFSTGEIQKTALEEYANMVDKLQSAGIKVLSFPDNNQTITPDAVFPNNWMSTHPNGTVYTYPMLVPNRREEHRKDIIAILVDDYGYNHVDLTLFERGVNPEFLEGTGSMVMDHFNKIVYAAISPRTNKELAQQYATMIGYTLIAFIASGIDGESIYHTNVMMSLGEGMAIIGTETIAPEYKNKVIFSIKDSDRKIISLTNEQVYAGFAGNMLQLKNEKNEKVMVLSKTAANCLTPEQTKKLLKYNQILLEVSIPTIEKIGGGSVRCMMAEIF